MAAVIAACFFGAAFTVFLSCATLIYAVLRVLSINTLAPNGAGKTTMLECIEGFRRYESGRIQVEGKTGVQLQSASLPAYIRPMEAVHLFEKWKKAKADPSVLEALEIGPDEEKAVYGTVYRTKRDGCISHWH